MGHVPGFRDLYLGHIPKSDFRDLYGVYTRPQRSLSEIYIKNIAQIEINVS